MVNEQITDGLCPVPRREAITLPPPPAMVRVKYFWLANVEPDLILMALWLALFAVAFAVHELGWVLP